MPRPQEKFDTREVAVICNIAEVEWQQQFDFGIFIIKGCQPGQKYALTEITGRDTRMDLGEKRERLEYIYAHQIAKDIARMLNADAGEDSFTGVFVCAGMTPTEAEVAEAHEKLRKFYIKRVARADSDWERTRSPIMIDDVDRRAARYLDLRDKPWLFDTQEAVANKCPACKETVKRGAAVCRHCGYIINADEAKKLGLMPEEKKAVKKERPAA